MGDGFLLIMNLEQTKKYFSWIMRVGVILKYFLWIMKVELGGKMHPKNTYYTNEKSHSKKRVF